MNRHEKIVLLAKYLGPLFLARKWQIALAESCSGGGLAYQITKHPGSSAWLKYSVVTYTDEAKQSILGVSKAILSRYTAVSAACAEAMLAGLDSSCARIAVTGYSGPSGDNVGRVYIAYAPPHEGAQVLSFLFLGERGDIQEQAIFEALKLLVEMAWIWQDEPKQDCFFALGVEDEATKHEVCQQALKMGFSASNLEPMSNFHLTLAHFSNQSEKDILGLIQKGENCADLYSGFDLSLSKLEYFNRADAWVLRLNKPAKKLDELASYFGAKDFLPHLTLSKRCNIKPDAKYLAFSIPWRVRSISFFLSFHGIFYKVIKTFILETKHVKKLH
jgi:nicotinamide-nucleotide amidase